MPTINLNQITKIEGHAKLEVKIEKHQVKKCKLRIFEGSRYFEGILKDKRYNDLSPIASRICGVCSVVHSIAAVKAVEAAFKIKVSEQTNLLRELLSIAGMLQSHVLHLYFLTLPDYLGYSSAIEMAKNKKDEIRRALKLKRLGNSIVSAIGGRDVHPFTELVGGFSHLPTKECIKELRNYLKDHVKEAKQTVELFSNLKYPKLTNKTEYFALKGGSYFYSDKIVDCFKGKCVPIENFEIHFKDYFRPDSTAEFVTNKNKEYMVGALARILNNQNLLSNKSKKYAKQIQPNNPFMNNIAQAIEINEIVHRALEILEKLNIKPEEPQEVMIKPGTGIGAIEAPRGILFHKYTIDQKGYCKAAHIITPTSQNLAKLEIDIKKYIPSLLNYDKNKVKLEIEKLIRSYDPCISCSTHFLEMDWQ